jgi:hypothetical protein
MGGRTFLQHAGRGNVRKESDEWKNFPLTCRAKLFV